eukprot:TRINITY_DN71_c1_g1_i1.p2 TRINITY_DN71_c1_g1~~TRINITY_DN71_c1_g1_i1.p2  ORF type:complete len:130 (-),score=28.12 TRINITY_DN71_c1_g1_i1:1508-1897(-)
MIPSVAGLVCHHNRVLLVKRSKNPHKGKWSVPGGKVEHNESQHDAVKRELLEETCLNVTPKQLIESHIIGDYTLSFYLCELDETCDPQDAKAGDDAADVMWVDVDDVEGIDEKVPELVDIVGKGIKLLG